MLVIPTQYSLIGSFRKLMKISWIELEGVIRYLEREYGNDEAAFSDACREWITDYSTKGSRDRIRYNDLNTDRYYFCHFGSAYAFEYSLLYQLVLLDMNGAVYEGDRVWLNKNIRTKELNILSLGSGSLIDLWSLCYAVSKFDLTERRLFRLKSYTGYDRCRWAIKFEYENFLRLFENYDGEAITEHLGDVDGDILNCFGEGVCIDRNIIIFPKIINELEDDLMEVLKYKISKTVFTSGTIYLCFSHSYTELEKGMENAARIIKAISGYDYINYNILDINPGDKSNKLRQIYRKPYLDFLTALQPDPNDPSVAYTFEHDKTKPYRCAIRGFDRNLSVSRPINYKNITLPQYFGELNEKHPCIPNVLNYPAGSDEAENPVKLVFQIVRLSR